MRLTLWLSAAIPTLEPHATVKLETAPPLQAVPVAVAPHEPTAIDLAGGEQGRSYVVLVASLARSEAAQTIHLGLRETDGVLPVKVAKQTVDPWWHRTVLARSSEMEARRLAQQADGDHVAAKIQETKSFHLFVKEFDFLDRDSYVEVKARIRSTGKHCLVYVDEEDFDQEGVREAADDIVDFFDGKVHPKSRELFGRHVDVDRNGRFIILMTHWLGNLSNGKVSLGGFVRGADFYRDVDPPLSNRSDMMYLNTNLKAGPHLRNILAHEYTHAVTFSEHVFGKYLTGESGLDEEAWLSEAISHLAENLIGSGWTNLDYRISAYLTAPERYRLVVPDYYRSGLWRCHGSRGSTYLFLRYCVERFGTSLLRQLSMSNLSGIDNLEAATRTPFEELFRDWTVRLALDGFPKGKSPSVENSELPALDLHGKVDTRQLAGLRLRGLQPGDVSIRIAPTSFLPLRVRVAPGQKLRLSIRASAETALQVTALQLPPRMPETILSLAPSPDQSGHRIELRQTAGAGVHWERITWESAFPGGTKQDESSMRAEILPAREVFGSTATIAGRVLQSDPIDLSRFRGQPIVFKLVGLDSEGRRVSAWTLCEQRALQITIKPEERTLLPVSAP